MSTAPTLKVLGHKSPDTDSTGSPLIWAWYLTEHRGQPAEAVLLGPPNAEAAFMLDYWQVAVPRVIDSVAGERLVIVDTNNPAELPADLARAEIVQIIDHHKLCGGLTTIMPIDVTIKPLACTATVMHNLMGENAARMPDWVKGLMLSCILSDTLGFRSPTTTAQDRALAERLAQELALDLDAYTAEMFAAKSDLGALSDAELLRMDSKEFRVNGAALRVSVLETTTPQTILCRKEGLMQAMEGVAREDGAEQVLLFVVDILNGQSTLLVPNAQVKAIAEKSFGARVEGDTVLLPGVVSRKKQIIPALSA